MSDEEQRNNALHAPLKRASKLSERRLRAMTRGFLQPRPRDASMQYLEVKREVATRAKSEAKALAVHYDLNKITGKTFHYASQAALAAASQLLGSKAHKSSYKTEAKRKLWE